MKKEYFVIVGWNLNGCCPEDNATVSCIYKLFENAREDMIQFVREDGLEDMIDSDIDISDKDLNCITIDNGIRGYYIQAVQIGD